MEIVANEHQFSFIGLCRWTMQIAILINQLIVSPRWNIKHTQAFHLEPNFFFQADCLLFICFHHANLIDLWIWCDLDWLICIMNASHIELLARGLMMIFALVVFLILGRRKHRYGLNFKRVYCPNCKLKQPWIRKPANKMQKMFGGWTCSKCKTQMDKYGDVVITKRIKRNI